MMSVPVSQPANATLAPAVVSPATVVKKFKATDVADSTKTVLPLAPGTVPIATSQGFPGGISLTISNGVINVKTAGMQGDNQAAAAAAAAAALGIRPTATSALPATVTMVKGHIGNIGNLISPVGTSQVATLPPGVTLPLKISNTQALQFRAPSIMSSNAAMQNSLTVKQGQAVTVGMAPNRHAVAAAQHGPQPIRIQPDMSGVTHVSHTLVPAIMQSVNSTSQSTMTANLVQAVPAPMKQANNDSNKDKLQEMSKVSISSSVTAHTLPITVTSVPIQMTSKHLVTSSNSLPVHKLANANPATAHMVPSCTLATGHKKPSTTATHVHMLPNVPTTNHPSIHMVPVSSTTTFALNNSTAPSIRMIGPSVTTPIHVVTTLTTTAPVMRVASSIASSSANTKKLSTVPSLQGAVNSSSAATPVQMVHPASASVPMQIVTSLSNPIIATMSQSSQQQQPQPQPQPQLQAQPQSQSQQPQLQLQPPPPLPPAQVQLHPQAQTQIQNPVQVQSQNQVQVQPLQPQTQAQPDTTTDIPPKAADTGGGVIDKVEELTPGPKIKIEPDNDPVNSLDWENGIATLPGSNIKFQWNEFGIMEIVKDSDLECVETMETSSDPGSADSVYTDTSSKPDSSTTNPECNDLSKCSRKDGSENCQCSNCKYKVLKRSISEKDECLERKKKRKLVLSQANNTCDNNNKPAVIKCDSNCKQPIVVKQEKIEEDVKKPIAVIPVGKKSKVFTWAQYLDQENAVGAPTKLFKEPFPVLKNGFKIGMKLEGIDPKHQSLYCVLSVAEVRGFRIRLHFDGYSECYDFWVNADSSFIFPVGWCEKNGRILQPPKGFSAESFVWSSYLKHAKAFAAPKHLFVNLHTQPIVPNLFRVGMKLEAVDKKNTSLICVATVSDVLGDRILIHFDGWEDAYDYWCDPTSPYIHSVDWCKENNEILSPPCDWKDPLNFSWERYLSEKNATAVPARAFRPRAPINFEEGMKIEVVDKRNPILIRVATIASTSKHRVKIHFDGWLDIYDYWLDDDSPDIHPPGWSNRTGHILQPPIGPGDLTPVQGQGGCPTPGCKGIGHIKGAKYAGHHSASGCSYSPLNMNKETTLQDRLGSTRVEEGTSTPIGQRPARAIEPSTVTLEMSKKTERNQHEKNCVLTDESRSPEPTESQEYQPVKDGSAKASAGTAQSTEQPEFQSSDDRRFKYLYPNKVKEEKEDKSFETNLDACHNNNGSMNSQLHHGVHRSVFMSALAPNPSKDLPLCWEQHSKLLPGVDKIRGDHVAEWKVDDVANFIKTLPGCIDLSKIFRDEHIDGEAFLMLNQTDIVKILNCKLGPALKIFNSILMFKSTADID